MFRSKFQIKNLISGIFAFFTFAFSFFAYADTPSDSVYSWKGKSSNHSQELLTIDRQLQELQQALENSTGIQEIYICGGAAIAVLDHIYLNKPLKMRDLDIGVVTHRELNGEDVLLAAHSFEQVKIGDFISNSFDFRSRQPLSIPFQCDTEYYAGYGFFLLSNNGLLIDLSFFENDSDLELNGFMDIDTVKIVLHRGESLIQLVEKAQKKTLDSLIKEGFVLDPHQGYSHWIKKDPSIIQWERIKCDPHLYLFRLIRSYTKLNLTPLPENLWKTFHNLCASIKPKQSRRLGQYLLRVLNDESAYKELKLLQEIGVFQCWLPELSELLERKSSQDLAVILDNKLISPTQKLMLLILQLPKEKQLETWFRSIYKFDFGIALEKAFDLLGDFPNIDRKFLKKCLEAISLQKREELESQLLRIIPNAVISRDERFDLIIRSIVLSQNTADPIGIIQSLIPDISNERLQALVCKVKGKRKGIITGVFDPIQNGHLALINTAIEQLVLDEILLIPVEVDSNRSTAPWQDRVAMIQIAARNIPEVCLPSYHDYEFIQEGIGAFITHYKGSLQQDDRFWHIMGSDAWQRYSKYGLWKKDNHPLAVFYRPDFPLTLEMQNTSRQLLYLNLKEKALDASCNEVRMKVNAGKSIHHLVPEGVANYISENKLYTLTGSLAKPFYLESREETIYKATKHYLPTIRVVEKECPLFYGEDIQSIVEKKLEYAKNEGLQDLIVVEISLQIDGLGGFPGVHTHAWMKKITPQSFLELIKIDPSLKAQLEVVVGFQGLHGENIYINLNSECDLYTLMQAPNFSWETLFFKPLPNRELSLIDMAITRLVRNLLSQEQIK